MNEHDVARDVATIAASRNPFVIGIRHHSAVCALAMDKWLDAARPDRVMVELPADLAPWLPWLAHEDLEAPVALAGSRKDGSALWFYPFADFSPELAAIRWARRRGVPVSAIDRPIGARDVRAWPVARTRDDASVLEHACVGTQSRDAEELWDSLVEARGFGADPESVRRAAIAFGRFVRADAELSRGTLPEDELREAFMRRAIADAIARGESVAAVVGAFHAHALLRAPAADAALPPVATCEAIDGSLVPYSFELLDSRSGYPAGVRDPMWQQRLFQRGDAEDVDTLVATVALEAAAELRARGHASGVADAIEVTRVARDLATLRRLVQPSRRELLEAITTAMGQGQPIGRQRHLAAALERVMVGRRRGRLAAGTPRSGLAVGVERSFEALSLPGPAQETARGPTERVLDPLRSPLDERRHVFLERLSALDVPYGTVVDRSSFVDAEALTIRWSIAYTPTTAARLELAGVYGASLEQAVAGRLKHEALRLDRENVLTIAKRFELAEMAAKSALAGLATTMLNELVAACLREASLAELLATAQLIERIRRGHVPGVDPSVGSPADESVILDAAVASVEGLSGSSRAEDSRALFDLIQHLVANADHVRSRLASAMRRIAADGAPRMQGAALGAAALLAASPPEELYARVGSFVDSAVDAEARAAMSDRLAGLLDGCVALFETLPELARELSDRIAALDDAAFATRLPSLRRGFAELSPAARQRLLDSLVALHGSATPFDTTFARDPVLDAKNRALDAEVGVSLASRGLLPDHVEPLGPDSRPRTISMTSPSSSIAIEDRWRLILGREKKRLDGAARRLATTLDGLYGRGQGEGSRGAGDDESIPSIREWATELDALFDADVREEVLARAAEAGYPAALLELGTEPVVPSVDLLEKVLALRGGLGEAQLARLRPLVAALVERLVRELARRVRPALAGLVSTRTSRRKTNVVDLRSTIRANLHTARLGPEGLRLSPDRLVFRTRQKKSLDWHVILVVDVSGSMEPSTIHAAIMAAILSGMPALSVRFHAFSTSVLDLTDRVDDPLALLLDVRVGGGTDIGRAIRHAREHVHVPSRTIVVVVSDFEEGGSVPALLSEVRALVDSGAHVLGLAALDERGAPRYHAAIAASLVEAGMPIAALTPVELARWIAEKIR